MHLLYISQLFPTDFPRLKKTIDLCGERIDRVTDTLQVWF